MEEHNFGEIKKIINELLRSGAVIPKQQIIDLARNEGIPEEEVIAAIKHFIEDGLLVELDKDTVEVSV